MIRTINQALDRIRESGTVWKVGSAVWRVGSAVWRVGSNDLLWIREANTNRCPLEVIFSLPPGKAKCIGDLPPGSIRHNLGVSIMNAADSPNFPLRGRLLKACGLAEENVPT